MQRRVLEYTQELLKEMKYLRTVEMPKDQCKLLDESFSLMISFGGAIDMCYWAGLVRRNEKFSRGFIDVLDLPIMINKKLDMAVDGFNDPIRSKIIYIQKSLMKLRSKAEKALSKEK